MHKLDTLFKRALSKTKPKNRSHFGASISTLLALKVLPLRNDPIEADIPDILLHLIDYLANDQYLAQEGIFRIAGSVKTVKDIIADIDQKGPQIIGNLGPAPLNCVCSILKQWIRDIPESFVGEDIYTRLYQVKDDPAQQLKVFQSIENPYRNLLIYICRFLLKIISFESQNKMSKANIAIIFGPNIFKAPDSLGNSNELSITVVEDNFRYIRWLELLLNNFHEIFETELGVSSSIHDDQEMSMYEFLRGNMQDVILNETPSGRSSYRDSERKSRRSLSVSERGTRSRHSSVLQDNVGVVPLRASNSRQSRPISLDLDEIEKYKFSTQTKVDSNFIDETIDQHPLVEENTSENTSSRTRRRESKTDSLLSSDQKKDENSPSEVSSQDNGVGIYNINTEMSQNRLDTVSQEEINKSLRELDDIPQEPLDQELLIHPSSFNKSSASNNENLRREYEELYYIENRNETTIARMCQILEQLRLENSLNTKHTDNIPNRTLSESDLSEDSVSKRDKDIEPTDVIIPEYLAEESPFSSSINRILKIRESEGRPLIFSSMSESQLEREKLVIRKELTRLKDYSKAKNDLNYEEKLMFKRLVCWYKELKTLKASLNKPEEAISTESEINTSFKYEKQIIKIRLHQYVIDFKKREGRSPTSSKDWEPMANDYRRYKELRNQLKDY